MLSMILVMMLLLADIYTCEVSSRVVVSGGTVVDVVWGGGRPARRLVPD